MVYVVRKTFDWQEDLVKYKFPIIGRCTDSSYRFHRKLSWKGKFRKWLGIRKPKENE